MKNNGRPDQAYTVSQVNGYIKNMFTQDFLLVRLYVRGEVSNCKYHNSGHIYFSLKDKGGTLNGVMFAGQRRGLSFPLKDGQQVLVLGSVSVYERDGRYQLYAKEILLDGVGQLYEQFARRKEELEEMGMFAQEYKKPIPFYSRRVGVVTAPRGAAIQDICNISRRRNPYVQLILYPAKVQGEGSAESIARGIQALDACGVDVIIVGRGGGSIEDLWAFNEEIVARAIFSCQTPVISAVGHETDTTIADYVADLRAPTPSAAAELAVADFEELLQKLYGYQSALYSTMEYQLEQRRDRLERFQLRLFHLSPRQRLYEKRMRAAELENRFEMGMEQIFDRVRSAVALYAERLEGFSPLRKLSQGYSYVTAREGSCVTQVGQVVPGDMLRIQVRDGLIHARVQETEKQEPDMRHTERGV
ncbi:MAG: exodeoxyribonuclease VII large subunit [Lachnospiraceae bacterium]|nr:exodeoxyribonuclease VII large subunit [Lachnospiraceae bacterium]